MKQRLVYLAPYIVFDIRFIDLSGMQSGLLPLGPEKRTVKSQASTDRTLNSK